MFLVFSACSHKNSVLRRVAILPANVLISDAGSDWMKIGVPLVLQQDLMASQYVSPSLAQNEAAALQGGAQNFLRVKVESRQGKIHIETEMVDAATQKATGTQQEDAASLAALIPALNSLAKKLDDTAGEFSTKNTDALKLFAQGAQDPNPQSRLGLFNQALTADPNFGMGYFLLIEMAAGMGPDSYKTILDKARNQRASFNKYDQARFDLIDKQMSRAPIGQRAAAADAVLKVAPNDIDALAITSSIRFLNGDVKGGQEAIDRAISMNPENPNLKAQLAEGLVQSKRYADAEKVLAKLSTNPAALPELASCILLEGDVARANQAAEKYFPSLQNPEYQAILRASWMAISGQRAKATSDLEAGKFTNANVRGLALSEAAVFRLMDKDYAGAKKTAEDAAKSDNHPTAITAVSSLLVAGSEAPADWRKKVESSQLSEAMREPVLAYGFFLNGHYAEAVEEWRKILDKSESADLRARAMLASSLDRAGKADEAKKVNVQPFLLRQFEDIYGAVAFSEMRRMVH